MVVLVILTSLKPSYPYMSVQVSTLIPPKEAGKSSWVFKYNKSPFCFMLKSKKSFLSNAPMGVIIKLVLEI